MSRSSISEQLDAVRGAVPGCFAAALADLSTGLVLLVSSVERLPQEVLDRLCATAADLLDGSRAQSAASLLGKPCEAVEFLPGSTRSFLRSTVDPAEVLCCIGSADVDAQALLAHSRQMLNAIQDAA